MKFLDLMQQPAVEIELSLEKIQEIIKKETSRELRFVNTALAEEQYSKLFKLVKFPLPLGFAIAATEDISAGTILFPYGGETSMVPTEAKSAFDQIEFLLSSDLPDGNTLQSQAQNFGDLGSLMMHLPDERFLEKFSIDREHWDRILQENTMQAVRDGVVYHVAKCDIPAGRLLGFSYGEEYWLDLGVSPLLIEKSDSSYKTLDLETISFDGMAALRDKEKQSTRLPLRCGGPGTRFYALYISQIINFICDKKNSEERAALIVETELLHLAIPRLSLTATLQKLVDPKEKKLKLKNLITFFDSVRVHSCAPPPGLKFVNGKTILPRATVSQ